MPSQHQLYMLSLTIKSRVEDQEENISLLREIESDIDLEFGLCDGKAHYQKYFECVDIDFLVDAIEGNDMKEETKKMKMKRKKKSKQKTDLIVEVSETLDESIRIIA